MNTTKKIFHDTGNTVSANSCGIRDNVSYVGTVSTYSRIEETIRERGNNLDGVRSKAWSRPERRQADSGLSELLRRKCVK